MFLNVAFVGEQGVGKASLKQMLVMHNQTKDSENNEQAPGMGSVSSIKIAGRRVKIDCVNTSDCLARPESFWRKQLHGLVLLYDMSSPTTFDAVSSLVRQVRAAGFLSASAKQAVPVVLLANKADRGGFVCSEVNEFCLEQNVKLVEVCCSQPDLKSTLQSARSAASASSQLREAAIVAIHQMIQEISASSRGGQSSPSGAPPSTNSLSSGGATPTASRRSRRQRRSSSFGMASQSGSTTDEIQDTSSSTASSSGAFDTNGAANALISAFQTECTVASSGSASAGPVPRLSFGHGSQVPSLATGGVSGCSSSSSGGANVPVSPSPSPKRRRRSLLDVGSNAFSAIIPHKKKKRRRDSLLQDTTDSESDASDSDSEMAMVDFDAQPQSGSSSLTPRGLFSSLSSGNKGEAGHQMGPFASQILNLDGAFALEDVLEVLLFGRQDSRQVQKLSEDFFMSFRSSITVNQLIDALIGRWRGPSTTVAADPTAAGRLLKSRRSIVDLLIKWMEVMDEEDPILCSADAETVMAKEKLSVFIESEIASIAHNSEAFDRLQLLWTKKFSQVILGGASNVPTSAAPQKPLATARLMELEPTIVAQQLTIMFSRMFSKIKTAELVDCAWANAEKAPNLSAIIRESNRIQQWVWSQVLQQAESIRERVQVIQWFIQVASRCLQPLKNFESMYAIVRGLTSLPVDRLKRTWSMVDDSLKKKLDSMNQMMLQPEGSTKSYRNELKRSNPPCVPYPGYWLSKLVRIKEQNGLLVPTLSANCSPESTLIVNLASFEANCKVIRWWKRYQQSQYNLSLDKDLLSLLRSITPTVTDDDQAYELSVQHEPVGQNVPVSSSEAGSTQSSSSSQESGSSLKKLRRLSSSSGSLNVNEKVDEKIKKLDRKANDLMQIYMALKATLTVDDTASSSSMAMQDVSCPSPSPIRRSGSGSVVLSEANLLTDEARRNYEDMMKQARKLLKKWATRCENTSKFLDYYSPDGERQSLRFADILSRSSAVETLCLVLSGRAIEPKTRLCIRKIFGQCLVGSESEQELLIQLIETQLQDVNADSIQLVNELIKCFKIPDSYLANRNKITIVTRQIDQERQHCDEVLARLEQLTAFFDPSANIPTSARAQQEDKLLTEVLESKRRVSVLVQQRQQLCQWKDNTKHVMFENYGKFLQTYESRLQKQRQDRRNTLIQRLNEAVTTQTNQKRLIDERYQSKQTDHSRQQKKIEARQRELLAEQQELERLLAENREKQRQAEAEAAKLQQRVARRKNEYRTKIDELQSHVKSLESEVSETERDQQLQNQKKQMMSRFFSYFQQVSQSARDANENQENHQRVVKDFYSTLSTQLSKRHQMMRDLREESRVMYDSVKSVERMQLRPEIILKEFPELIQKCKDLLNRSDRFRADYISFAKTCVPEASEISTLVQVVPAAHSCLKLSEELADMIRQVADARQYLFKFASI